MPRGMGGWVGDCTYLALAGSHMPALHGAAFLCAAVPSPQPEYEWRKWMKDWDHPNDVGHG